MDKDGIARNRKIIMIGLPAVVVVLWFLNLIDKPKPKKAEVPAPMIHRIV